MGSLEDIKSQLSLQDLGMNTAQGVLGGFISPRLFGGDSKGTVLAGAILGTATYITDLVPEKHMSPMRSSLLSIFTLGLVVFGLKHLRPKYPGNFLVQLLPADIKPLICVAALNAFGKTMMIYFTVIFPGFKTAPVLPKNLKDLFDLSSKEIRACHTYYTGNAEAFTDLPVKTQIALNYNFERETLSSLASTPLTATSFDSWEIDDLKLMREQSVSMGSADVTKAFETKCYTSELEPPETISETFTLPATPAEILTLKLAQQKWFVALFKTYPVKWEELSPAKQLAFHSFPEFVDFSVRLPKQPAEVTELHKDDVLFFHKDFESTKYSPETGLALIKRFAEEGLKLPTNIQEQLAKLAPVTTEAQVPFLRASDLELYRLQMIQNPETYWNSLDVTIRWAFHARGGKWPPMSHPTTRIEIQGLDKQLVTHFHSTFSKEQIPTEDIRLAWYEKFYDCELPPRANMVQDYSRILQSRNEVPFFQNFSNTGQVGLLPTVRLKWFAGIYQHYRNAWINLPLNYQAQFRLKATETIRFPTFTYPRSKEEVDALDHEATKALQREFDLKVMLSEGPGFFSRASSPLADQNPALFKLQKNAREKVLEELGKKFSPPLPDGFESYIEPPQTQNKIDALDSTKLQYWGKYFCHDTEKWQKTPLVIQVAYCQQAQKQHVPANAFPPLEIKNNELVDLVTKGNGTHVGGPLLAENPHYKTLLYLVQTAHAFSLENWVMWPRVTQDLLKTAFLNFTYPHEDARVGGAIPPTPANVPLAGMDKNLVKAFHNNFHPTAFTGLNRDALLNAFLQKFLENLPEIGVLGLPVTLLKNIDLTNFTDEDRAWAQMLLSHEHGQTAWKELSCLQQLVYRRECADFKGGIPITYKADHQPNNGHYTRPTLDEINDFSIEDLRALHDYYDDRNNPWMDLDYAVQSALNQRFSEISRAPLITPWNVDETYARSLTQDSYKAKSLLAFYANHSTLWHALDEATRTELVAKSTAHYLNVDFNEGKHASSTKLKFYMQRIQPLANHLTNRVKPYMTKRNLIVGGITAGYVVTELAGIPNLIPDPIFEYGVKGTLGLAWSVVSGTTAIGWSILSYPFSGGAEVPQG